jgi:hypothetical protein
MIAPGNPAQGPLMQHQGDAAMGVMAGFSPEQYESFLVAKHRAIAHETLMLAPQRGITMAWRAARQYADLLKTMATKPFLENYVRALHAYTDSLRAGRSPERAVRMLVSACDEEMKDQGRLGAPEVPVSMEDFGTGLVTGEVDA